MTVNDNIKERLSDMAALNQSRTPADALACIEELEAKLARGVEMLEREILRVQKIQRDIPPPHTVGLIFVEEEYELMLAELKGEK